MHRNHFTRMLGALAVVAMAACGGDADEPAEAPADMETAAPAEPAGPSFASVQFPEGVTAEMAQQGQSLFNQGVCMACHGMNGTGSPLGPALTDQTWINIDGSYEGIVSVIRSGVAEPKEHPGPMPALGGGQFTDEQVNQLAAYVYALSHGG